MAETQKNSTEEESKPSNEPKTEQVETKALTQEDINKLIESARKQEKDKLYSTITELKDQVSSLTEAQKKEKQEKDEQAATVQAAAEQERQAKLSAEDRMAEQLKRFEERLAKEAEEREKLQHALEEERQLSEVERYKADILKDAGDELVRELVSGKTKGEVDQSVATAKTVYQQYFQAAVKNAEGDPGRKLSNVTDKMPKPADPDPDPADEQGLKGLIPQIDPYASGAGKVSEDYKKNRDEILARVDSAYRKSATR